MNVMNTISEHTPSGLVIVCMLLTWLIPVSISWINRKLHEWGDPAWKRNSSPPHSTMQGNEDGPIPNPPELRGQTQADS